jgi:galactokinase
MSTIQPPQGRAPLEVATEAFRRVFGQKPDFIGRAPGRVNLIGEHVDYNDGLVLPVAVDLEVGLAVRRRQDDRVSIYSADMDEQAEFAIAGLAPGSVKGWAAYPAGVAWSLAQAGLMLRGIDAAVSGNVPLGGGLSSSAALEVAFAAAFRHASELDLPDVQLARLCQAAENQFVGVACGIMDQMTSACAEPGRALLLDCRSMEIRQVPLPPALQIVIFHSGVPRRLSASEYNQRRRECEEAAGRLAAVDDDIRTLRDITPEQLLALSRHLPAPLDRRARHVVGEIERVQLAAAALESGETERFGELLFASHRSLRDDYQVSCEELDALVELARRAPGVVGARLTGAGFGGCTVNVVSAALVESFIAYVGEGFEKLYSRAPERWVTGAAAGASIEPVGW